MRPSPSKGMADVFVGGKGARRCRVVKLGVCRMAKGQRRGWKLTEVVS